MSNQIFLAAVAVGLGLVVGVLLFVPFVAVAYRRFGRLTLGRVVIALAALVYFWAIWTFTLLPLPDPDALVCVSPITDPRSVLHDLDEAFAAPGNPLRQPALLQLVFNVLLFVPLGFFVRWLANRGVLVALVTGFGVSLAVELTQLTGVWGLYPCSYRFFDVGDLMTNTSGAVVGAILGLVIPRHARGLAPAADAGLPRPVTRGRRVLAMLCDGLGYVLVSNAIATAVQIGLAYLEGMRSPVVVDGEVARLAGVAAAGGVWLLVILATGRSVGDLAVQLRYSGGPIPAPVARILRWLGGIAGLDAIGIATGRGWVTPVLALAACVLVFVTRRGRGLPGLISGQGLDDARQRVPVE